MSSSSSRTELQALRLMTLHERCLAAGIDAATVDDAMDAGEPKAALIALLLDGAGAGTSRAAQLVSLLDGGPAEREAAYTELLRLEAEHYSGARDGAGSGVDVAEIAVACASPLCAVLYKDAVEVGAEEYRRACQVLTALSGVDPARVGGECTKPDQPHLWKAWCSTQSALGVMLAKDPAELTR